MVKPVKKTKAAVPKVIVLDMDETLGAFTALSVQLKTVAPYLLNYFTFCDYLRNNLGFFRPNIFHVLQKLNAAKNVHGLKVVLYTSNPNSVWVSFVLRFLHEHLNFTEPLFDHVLDGAQQTCPNKSVVDLLNRTKLSPKSPIFFVDDQHHEGMFTSNVVYFRIRPYAAPNCWDIDPSHELDARLFDFITNFHRG